MSADDVFLYEAIRTPRGKGTKKGDRTHHGDA
jgi:hypothetical protein